MFACHEGVLPSGGDTFPLRLYRPEEDSEDEANVEAARSSVAMRRPEAVLEGVEVIFRVQEAALAVDGGSGVEDDRREIGEVLAATYVREIIKNLTALANNLGLCRQNYKMSKICRLITFFCFYSALSFSSTMECQ